jgi:hypothetical protein
MKAIFAGLLIGIVAFHHDVTELTTIIEHDLHVVEEPSPVHLTNARACASRFFQF